MCLLCKPFDIKSKVIHQLPIIYPLSFEVSTLIQLRVDACEACWTQTGGQIIMLKSTCNVFGDMCKMNHFLFSFDEGVHTQKTTVTFSAGVFPFSELLIYQLTFCFSLKCIAVDPGISL